MTIVWTPDTTGQWTSMNILVRPLLACACKQDHADCHQSATIWQQPEHADSHHCSHWRQWRHVKHFTMDSARCRPEQRDLLSRIQLGLERCCRCASVDHTFRDPGRFRRKPSFASLTSRGLILLH